ncbi:MULTISPECIES: NAD-dependent epimerase/dehydratase family protein [unclassified Streptomyces]|uniref:NAD-dependent epimerase/dehydratase family protein n=1 Tax=unclassified Streptomyces TaxID=2593676 RepID=UPI002365A6AA|nr:MULTISPECIES: NAD-dependent epimerase/dehydratase family protein [unclassified Streptomyces]MDF3142277.1 NAD-dependent epimerase/dehydratase family protein [Streptomyces sp. T21Q-yed]WDF37856.1 NAD-dependent epimerase/dehydratase family protein [Streptomyces sp. T12]
MTNSIDAPREAEQPFVCPDVSGLRVVVTGATGFVGRRLCRRIVESGGRVTALVRPQSDRGVLDGCPVDVAVVDLLTGSGVVEAVSGADVVIHLAAAVRAASRAEFRLANTVATGVLAGVLASSDAPPRLVVCSSLAAAGPAPVPGRARREEDRAGPVSWYGASKLAGEQAARRFAGQVPTVIVRPPIVYGPSDVAFVPNLAAMARTRVAVRPGPATRLYSVLHVDDLCDGLIAAGLQGRTAGPSESHSGVYHLCDGVEYTLADLVRTAGALLGCGRPLVLPVPSAVVRAAGVVSEAFGRLRGGVPVFNRDKAREAAAGPWTATADRANRDFGFRARVGLEDGLREAFKEMLHG